MLGVWRDCSSDSDADGICDDVDDCVPPRRVRIHGPGAVYACGEDAPEAGVTEMWKTSAVSVEGMDTSDVQTPVPATTTAGLVGKAVLVSIKRAQGAQTRRRATTMPRHPSKTALVSKSTNVGYAVATAFLKAIVTVRVMSLTAVEYALETILLAQGAPTKWRATTTLKPSF